MIVAACATHDEALGVWPMCLSIRGSEMPGDLTKITGSTRRDFGLCSATGRVTFISDITRCLAMGL